LLTGEYQVLLQFLVGFGVGVAELPPHIPEDQWLSPALFCVFDE